MINIEVKHLKIWLVSGLVQSFAMGIVVIKALWDSYWLDQSHQNSFFAFGFVFPILMLINMFALSLTNATVSTFKNIKWIDKERVDKYIFKWLSICALVSGGVISGGIYLLMPLLSEMLGATLYKTELQLFAGALFTWLPLQFLVTIWLSIARGAGYYNASGWISIICHIVGMLVTYLLLNSKLGLNIEPITTVVYSSAITALLILLYLIKSIWFRFTFYTKEYLKGAFDTPRKMFLQVFNSTFIASIFALSFIFVLTRLLAEQGESVIGAMVYITRIEQLTLIMYGGFINVMLPELAHLIQKKLFADAYSYIKQAGYFLIMTGAVFICLLYAILLFGHKITGSAIGNETLLIMSKYWLVGLLFQGAAILYLQIINIIIKPALAPKINFIRFIILAIPLLFLANFYLGLEGILYSLPLIQIFSLAFLLVAFRFQWTEYTSKELVNSQYNVKA